MPGGSGAAGAALTESARGRPAWTGKAIALNWGQRQMRAASLVAPQGTRSQDADSEGVWSPLTHTDRLQPAATTTLCRRGGGASMHAAAAASVSPPGPPPPWHAAHRRHCGGSIPALAAHRNPGLTSTAVHPHHRQRLHWSRGTGTCVRRGGPHAHAAVAEAATAPGADHQQQPLDLETQARQAPSPQPSQQRPVASLPGDGAPSPAPARGRGGLLEVHGVPRLADAQLLRFERDGHVLTRGLLPAGAVSELAAAADALVAQRKLTALRQRCVGACGRGLHVRVGLCTPRRTIRCRGAQSPPAPPCTSGSGRCAGRHTCRAPHNKAHNPPPRGLPLPRRALHPLPCCACLAGSACCAQAWTPTRWPTRPPRCGCSAAKAPTK